MENQIQKPINPLTMFMRQPKIYVRLPSNGAYWPNASLTKTENGEYPVYSMTAKDELILKVPDALMNGQAVVDVIQNCIPNIKNAWDCPSMDIDFILVAIRLATYGEYMTTPVKVPNGEEFEYNIDLRTVMDQLLTSVSWESAVTISPDLTVFVKPTSYRNMTSTAMETFETQKILQLVNDDKLSDEEKIDLFKVSFDKLSIVTLGNIENSIDRIESSQGATDNRDHIKEFVANIDKEIFDKIENHIQNLNQQNAIKPVKVTVTEEMQSLGITGETLEIPLTFDASTFFV